jgi:hypothetical protein
LRGKTLSGHFPKHTRTPPGGLTVLQAQIAGREHAPLAHSSPQQVYVYDQRLYVIILKMREKEREKVNFDSSPFLFVALMAVPVVTYISAE